MPPPLFRLAQTKSGWRASEPTKIRLMAAGDFSGGGIRRDLVNGGTSHY